MLFDPLRETLLSGGIAPRHVRRYLGELEDHLVELTRCEEDAGYAPVEAAARARALLGDDALLADAMLSRPDLRSLTARAPWLVFGILPPFLVLAAFLVPVLTVIGVAKVSGMSSGHGIDAPLWYQQLVLHLAFASTLLLPGLTSSLLVGLAMRQRASALWPAVSAILIVFLNVQWQAGFPAPGQHGGHLVVSVWFLQRGPAHPDWQIALAQSVLALSPLLYAMARRTVALQPKA